jgi:hypothetical protein
VEHIVNGELKLMLRNLLELMWGATYVLVVATLAQLLCLPFKGRSGEEIMLLLIILILLFVLDEATSTGTHT